MSRVNEAMHRAGQGGDEHEIGVPVEAEEAPFATGTDSVSSPEPESEPVASEGALVPRVRTVPIEVTRREESDEIQLVDIVHLLLARWRLICCIVLAALGLAAVYNRLATPI